ncbi:hypothetical protein BDQ12DRAFT_669329 [Crucibulum laeve]|uniref:Frag1/DRAM/Sfk1 family-domain-containing protein n=1 Tax=Crucibulum laeve TaxID=68775 RepID=A0A5C3LN23_9AGAR|nr:hypothetical protein BDQ12DRAFT_669329 [Crucibulum laeve]
MDMLDSVCKYYTVVALQGHILAGIAYGLVLALFLLCFHLITGRTRSPKTCSRQDIAILIYVSFMFFCATLGIASNALQIQEYIRSGLCPQSALSSLGKVGDVCFVLLGWGADGLLIWRCIVVYQGARIRRWVLPTIAGFMALISFAFLIFPSDMPLWIYTSISLLINIIVTTLIIGRLYTFRRRIVKALGPMHGTHYTNTLSIIIESAALVLIFMTFVVATAFGVSPLYEIMATEALIQVQAIAALWIIFRVAQGKAWGGNTSDEITRNMTTFVTTPRSSMNV